MTINTRRLSGVLLVVAATTGPVLAQSGAVLYPPPPGRYAEPTPSGSEPPLGVPMPAGRPPAAVGQGAVDRVGAPARIASEAPADPYGSLTGQSIQPSQQSVGGLPNGSYPSPYLTDGPGCAGPLGRNGRISYEIYLYTGPTFALGEGRFARQLQMGWMTGGSGRSLFFNPEHDAAWAVDIGLSYQYNRGSPKHFTTLELRQGAVTNPITGQRTPRPDVLAEVAVRSLSRTNFNFGVGRDWWFWGPGATGVANGWNYRFGSTLGGRWGTAHIDEEPQDVARFGDYARRQGVTHGIFIETHATVEIPMGAWILFGGLRTEWGYDWMNLFPPQEGNLHNINVLMTAGFRF